MLLQFGHALGGDLQAFLALEGEGTRDHRHCQDAQFPGHFGDYRGATGTGATAHTRGNKHHIRSAQGLGYAIPVFQRGGAPDVRVGTGAQALGDVTAKLQHGPGLDVRQCLGVGIGADEIHAFHVIGNHMLDRVAAAAAHTDYLDDCIRRYVIDKFKHGSFPFEVDVPRSRTTVCH